LAYRTIITSCHITKLPATLDFLASDHKSKLNVLIILEHALVAHPHSILIPHAHACDLLATASPVLACRPLPHPARSRPSAAFDQGQVHVHAESVQVNILVFDHGFAALLWHPTSAQGHRRSRDYGRRRRVPQRRIRFRAATLGVDVRNRPTRPSKAQTKGHSHPTDNVTPRKWITGPKSQHRIPKQPKPRSR
jgi:hypothetical protein